MEQFNDRSKMIFGKYKGQTLASIPDEYLLWLHGELVKRCTPFAKPLKEYLDENIDAIKQNISQKYPKPFFND